jgi:hypothetical protein
VDGAVEAIQRLGPPKDAASGKPGTTTTSAKAMSDKRSRNNQHLPADSSAEDRYGIIAFLARLGDVY